MLNLKFRTTAKHKISGLQKAPKVLRDNLRKGMFAIGKRLVTSSKARMRKDTGAAHKSLQIQLSGSGIDLGLLVFSKKIQAIIDASGLTRGIFPPFGENTRLWRWARRKAYRASEKVERSAVPKRSLFQLNRNFERRQRMKTINKVRPIPKARRPGNKRIRAQNNNARRLAFLVARKIYRKGIRATHWNKKALEANKNRITREITNSIARAINQMARG